MRVVPCNSFTLVEDDLVLSSHGTTYFQLTGICVSMYVCMYVWLHANIVFIQEADSFAEMKKKAFSTLTSSNLER